MLDYEAGVLATETEAVRERYVDFGFSGYVRDVVEVAVWIRFFLINCRVKNVVVDAVNADDRFQRT